MESLPSLSPSNLGFVRAAVISPELRVADVAFNTQAIIAALREAAGQGCRLAVFPELCITGYSCGDLFYQRTCWRRRPRRWRRSRSRRRGRDRCRRRAAAGGGRQALQLRGAHRRRAGAGHRTQDLPAHHQRVLRGALVHVGQPGDPARRSRSTGGRRRSASICSLRADNLPDCVIGIEICEDLWAVNPPSGDMALAGATILLNGSASNELLGKVEYRRDLVRQQSARCLAAYLYAGAGPGESTTDTVWAGHSLIAENGAILAETERFRFETQMAVADVDVQRLMHERLHNHTFGARPPAAPSARCASICPVTERWSADEPLIRPQLSRTPFVPADPERRAMHCQEIFSIQSTGLAKRLRHTGDPACHHRRVGRAGLDAGAAGHGEGVRSGGAAARGHRRHHHARLRHHGAHAQQRRAAGRGPGRHAAHDPHRRRGAPALPRHRPRREQARRDLRKRPGARTHADPDGRRQPDRRLRRRHGRSVGAGAGLVHLQRRSHVDVPRQRRRAEDAGALSGRVGG